MTSLSEQVTHVNPKPNQDLNLTEALEEWKWANGYEGKYEVSTLGRVKSYAQSKPRILNPSPCKNGYLRVDLSKDGIAKHFFVHKLVLETFIGEFQDGEETRHMNGDPADNRLENLKIGTCLENASDRLRHGTTPRGEVHPGAKLTRVQVVEIRRQHKHGETKIMLARKYGISRRHISNIVNNRCWKHL